MVATAAPDRTCGANAIVRTAPRPFSGRLNRKASASPITRLPTTIRPVNTMVIHSVLWNAGSVSVRP